MNAFQRCSAGGVLRRRRDRRRAGAAASRCPACRRPSASTTSRCRRAPALELPPDLTHAELRRPLPGDHRDRPRRRPAPTRARARSSCRPTPDAKIVRAGNERWLVVKATPEQAWNTSREFWQESGFVLAIEQPQIGVMETDFAENRADIPRDFLRRTVGKYIDVFYTTYKQDKFRTRIERGAEPNTVEIYVSHRGMEQVPTGKIDNSSPAALRVGGDAAQSRARGRDADAAHDEVRHAGARGARRGRAGRDRAGSRAHRQEPRRLVQARRSTTRSTARGAASAWRSTAPASPSSTATARAASTSSATAIPTRSRKKANDAGWLAEDAVLEDRREGQAGAVPDRRRRGRATTASSACRTRAARRTSTPTSEKILALLKDQLK